MMAEELEDQVKELPWSFGTKESWMKDCLDEWKYHLIQAAAEEVYENVPTDEGKWDDTFKKGLTELQKIEMDGKSIGMVFEIIEQRLQHLRTVFQQECMCQNTVHK